MSFDLTDPMHGAAQARGSVPGLRLMSLAILSIAIALYMPRGEVIWLVATIGVTPFVLSLATGARDVLRPSVLVPLIYALYAAGPALVNMGYSADTMAAYGVAHLAGIVSLMLGLRIGEGTLRERHPVVNYGSHDVAAMQMTIAVLLALGAVGIATQVRAFGGFGGLIAVGYGGKRYEVLRATQTFGAGFDWWLLACGLLWFMAVETRRYAYKLAAVTLAVPILLLLLKIGGRSTLVYFALFVFVLVHEGHHRVRPLVVVSGLVVGVVVAQFYSLARFFLAEGLWTSLRATWRIALESPWALLPTASNEFRAPTAALLDVLQFAPHDHWWGRSYAEAVATTVPGLANALGLHGPTPSTWRLLKFHPEVLSVGGGLGFCPAAEGWLNFGFAGVIAHLAIYGLTIGFIFRFYRSRPGVAALLLLAGAMPMFALDGLRIHSAAFLYKTTRVYLLPLIVFAVARDLLRAARSRAIAADEEGA